MVEPLSDDNVLRADPRIGARGVIFQFVVVDGDMIDGLIEKEEG